MVDPVADDILNVIEHVAGIPIPTAHSSITTSMPKEIIEAAQRVLETLSTPLIESKPYIKE